MTICAPTKLLDFRMFLESKVLNLSVTCEAPCVNSCFMQYIKLHSIFGEANI